MWGTRVRRELRGVQGRVGAALSPVASPAGVCMGRQRVLVPSPLLVGHFQKTELEIQRGISVTSGPERPDPGRTGSPGKMVMCGRRARGPRPAAGQGRLETCLLTAAGAAFGLGTQHQGRMAHKVPLCRVNLPEGRSPSFPDCNSLNVSGPEILVLKPQSQCDGIWTWGLWRGLVVRVGSP